jgi:hypothetical protein
VVRDAATGSWFRNQGVQSGRTQKQSAWRCVRERNFDVQPTLTGWDVVYTHNCSVVHQISQRHIYENECYRGEACISLSNRAMVHVGDRPPCHASFAWTGGSTPGISSRSMLVHSVAWISWRPDLANWLGVSGLIYRTADYCGLQRGITSLD